MKIGVISDTHISQPNHALPKKIFEIFKDVDLILHAGDLTDKTVIDQLETIAPVEVVRGNMDSYQIPYPIKKTLQLEEIRLGLIHGYGSPTDIRKRIAKEFDKDINIIVYGHSHAPDNEYDGNILFFNPGSPTDKRYAPYHSVGIIELLSNQKINSHIVKL